MRNKSFQKNSDERLTTTVKKQQRQQTLQADLNKKGIRVQYRNTLRHFTGIHTNCAPWDCRAVQQEAFIAK